MKDAAAKGIETLDFKSEELKIIHRYRYLSWYITSIFYFWGNPDSHWILRLGVIVLLFLSARITIEIYNKYNKKEKNIMYFIFMETMGIILLLLPTGGVNSPFIWYALNPVLISASFSFYYFCWLNLLCYVSASILISFHFYNPNGESLSSMVVSNAHLILIFILITLAVQLLTKLSSKLRAQGNKLMEVNKELHQANNKIHESISHIMSLYEAVETLTSNKNNKEDIYILFTEYITKLTGADTAFFWLKSADKGTDMITINPAVPEDTETGILSSIRDIDDNTLLSEEIFKIHADGCNYHAAAVKSTSGDCGLIGFKANANDSDIVNGEYIKQLKFISRLAAIVLERFHLEQVTERLIIAEEQNRIANEMHDSVAQGLFSISYAIHSLIQNGDRMSGSQLQESLRLLQKSAQLSMEELRSTIYRLSSKKGGRKSFKQGIAEYINTISKLNNIDINLKIDGDEELLSIPKKRGLYRIICEAAGNAIRHGRCSLIEINLDINKSFVELSIADNGEGFTVSNIGKDSGRTGLGISNMKRIVDLFNGEIFIDGKPGNGTVINIHIPGDTVVPETQEGIAI
ncbi:MAG: ATP-binding protein [Caldicoprobacteraceae bacterium]|jgi:signal transduction histidine kinase